MRIGRAILRQLASPMRGARRPSCRRVGHRGGSVGRQLGVDRFAQGLARLEVRHQLLGDGHLLAASAGCARCAAAGG